MSQLPNREPLEKPPNRRLVPAVLADRAAAVAIEYALLGSVMALVAIASVTLFGDAATGLLAWVSGQLVSAMPP